MKKQLVTSAFILSFFSLLHSQSFSVFQDGSSVNCNGQTIDLWADTTVSEMQIGMNLKNTSDSTKTVKMKFAPIVMITGMYYSFCSPLACQTYSGHGEYAVTGDVSAPPGELQLFSLACLPMGLLGTSTINYVFFNVNNPGDSVSVRVNYHVSPLGINSYGPEKNNIDAYPNPANNGATFTYQLESNTEKSMLYICDLYGRKIDEYPVTEKKGAILVNTSELANGVYFYQLVSSGNHLSSTKKMIVDHSR